MKKLVSLLLCAVLMLSLIPLGVISASAEVVPVYYHYNYVIPGEPTARVELGRTDANGYVDNKFLDRDDEGMCFIGWYEDEDFYYPFDFTVPVDEETHLYARWWPYADCVSVWIYLRADAQEPTAGVDWPRGASYPEPDEPGQEGYTFFGWYTDRALTQPYDPYEALTEDVCLYPRFVRNEDVCSVHIYLDADDEFPTAGVDLEKGEVYGTPASPGRDNEIFAGWYTDRALTKPYDGTAPITQNTDLFAKWITGDVVYVYVYSDPLDQDPYETLTVAKGNKIASPAAYQFDGQTFRAWYTDRRLTKLFDASKAITANTSLYPLYITAAPKITGFTNGEGGVTIRWNGMHGSYFRVFRKGPKDTSWKKLGDTQDTCYLDNTAESGTTYTYTVRCTNYYGNVYTSSYNTTGWKNTCYKMPEVMKVTSDLRGLKVTCSASPGAAKYRFYRKNGSSWKTVATVASTSFVDTTVVSGDEYTYTVRAMDSSGSLVTDYDRIGVTAAYVAAPKIAKIENTTAGAKLTFTKPAGAAKIRVFMKYKTGWKKLTDTASTTYVHAAAGSGVTYTYTVRALDMSGSYCSAYDTTGVSNKYIETPNIPTLKNSKNGVQITSEMPKGAVKYAVFRKAAGASKWTRVITNIAASTKTVTDKTAKNGTKYAYTIRCLSSDGKSYVSDYDRTGRTITCKR